MYAESSHSGSPETMTHRRTVSASRAGSRRQTPRGVAGELQEIRESSTTDGPSQRAISGHETVTEYPPTAVIVELAKVLDVSPGELLGLRSPPKAARAKEDLETRRLWKKLQLVMALPEKDRRAVIRLANSLVVVKATQRG